MSDASERIDKIKTRIILSRPWYATIMLQLHWRESDEIPTMATDGTSVLYNAEFTMSLPMFECEGVVLHELGHVALLHSYRRGGRNPLRWNIACDTAVNALLDADGISLPKNGIPPGPLGKTAEELYDEYEDTSAVTQDVFDFGLLSQSSKDGNDSGENGKGYKIISEQDWKETLAMARGLAPASTQRQIDDIFAPKIDWRDELVRFISSNIRSVTHTWSRLHRRYSPAPGWKREPSIDIAVCIDTSGSINTSQMQRFASEFSAICDITAVTAYLISADAAVHEVIEPGQPFPQTLSGGGGTDFAPGLAKANELRVNGIVYQMDKVVFHPRQM